MNPSETAFPGLAALAFLKQGPPRLVPLRARRGRFLRGPIPLGWLIKAAELGDATLRVGLVLWYLRGVNRSPSVRLTTHALALFQVSQASKVRSLRKLEAAGLVSVDRRSGKNPTVSVLVGERASKA